MIANNIVRYCVEDIDSEIKSKCGFGWVFEGVLSDEKLSGDFDLEICCSIVIRIDSIRNLIMFHICVWGISICVEIRMGGGAEEDGE